MSNSKIATVFLAIAFIMSSICPEADGGIQRQNVGDKSDTKEIAIDKRISTPRKRQRSEDGTETAQEIPCAEGHTCQPYNLEEDNYLFCYTSEHAPAYGEHGEWGMCCDPDSLCYGGECTSLGVLIPCKVPEDRPSEITFERVDCVDETLAASLCLNGGVCKQSKMTTLMGTETLSEELCDCGNDWDGTRCQNRKFDLIY